MSRVRLIPPSIFEPQGSQCETMNRVETELPEHIRQVRPFARSLCPGRSKELKELPVRSAVFVAFLLFFLLMPLTVEAQTPLWSGILPSPQGINWSNAGVVGGIPAYTQCGATVAAGASAATVNADLASCASNPPCTSGKYVLLGPGNFTFTTGIAFHSISCVELRGSGANSTFITFTGADACNGTAADFCITGSVSYNLAPQNVANWTAGYALGTTTITLSSVTNLSVGMYIILDETDDTSDSGDVYICQFVGAACSIGGTGGGTRESPARSQEQDVIVTQCDGISTFGHACSSGTNITISPGLYMPNWSSSKTPQAWWGTTEAMGDGVSYLSADHSASAPPAGVEFFDAMNSWYRGNRSIGNTGRTHVDVFNADHIAVQDNYLWLQGPSASVNYGMSPIPAGDSLFQNNICEKIQACYPADAPCSGCVFAYNFDINNYFVTAAWLNQSGFPHSEGDDHMLYEGNIGAGVYSDNFHGSHNFQTVFRNYWNGYQENNGSVTSGNTIPLIFDSFSRFYNVIGNVLGSTQLCGTCSYNDTTSSPTSANVMYVIGIGNTINNDPNTLRTIFRWGNWDVVTGATRWCGNSSDTGWSTTCASTSEVPSTITNYAVPIPTLGDTGAGMGPLPASFYLSSEPSWWPNTIPWPAIGPDVTGGNVLNCSNNQGVYALTNAQCASFGGSSSNGTAGHVYAIPAMACYYNVMGGSANGTDASALSFNPSTCYGQTLASNPPQSPTNLTATVN